MEGSENIERRKKKKGDKKIEKNEGLKDDNPKKRKKTNVFWGECQTPITPDRVCGMLVSTRMSIQHKHDWHEEVKCSDKSCDMMFSHKQLMKEHFQEEHQKYFRCPNFKNGCDGEKIRSLELLKEHVRECEKSEFATKKEPPKSGPVVPFSFVCDVEKAGVKCGMSFPTNKGLIMHHANYHRILVGDTCTVMVTADRMCGKPLHRCQRWEHNKNWHIQVKCFKESCDETFPHNILMREHYNKFHKKTWVCKNLRLGCRQTYITEELLLEHEVTCDPSKKPFVCRYDGECLSRFMNQGRLMLHLYLKHSLDVLQAREYVGTLVEDVSEEEESEDDDGEEVVAKKRVKLPSINIPVDPETGAKFQLFKFGKPAWQFDPLDYGYFWIFYHHGLRVPIFTFQILFPELLSSKSKETTPGNRNFRLDRSLPKIFRRGNNDYKGLAVHRGHLVRYTDYESVPVTATNTCLFTNVLPMFSHFNMSAWSRVEHATAQFSAKHVVTFIVTIGLFQDPVDTIGPRNLPMPNRFGKVMLGLNPSSNLWDLTVYDLDHEYFSDPDKPLSEMLGHLEQLESHLNTKFFPELREDQLGNVMQERRLEEELQYHYERNMVELL